MDKDDDFFQALAVAKELIAYERANLGCPLHILLAGFAYRILEFGHSVRGEMNDGGINHEHRRGADADRRGGNGAETRRF